MSNKKPIVIIGAGIAGLTAGYYLHKMDVDFIILEASDGFGGRVRTDIIDGFRLDRGFQVFLTAYPEAKKVLNYEALNLKYFLPGAYLFNESDKLHLIGDFRRDFSMFSSTLFSNSNNISDKVKLLRLVLELRSATIEEIFIGAEEKTSRFLLDYGFTNQFISVFWQPFFAGIFLEQDLETSSRMFKFVLKMFAEGMAAIPERGMQEIPNQLAHTFGVEKIKLNAKVKSVEYKKVILENGEVYESDFIIDATNALHLNERQLHVSKPSTLNIYFTSNTSPLEKAAIALNSSVRKFVNNFVVLDRVSEFYTVKGKHLISVSAFGYGDFTPETLTARVKEDLKEKIQGVETWQYLHHYHIKDALPNQTHVRLRNEIRFLGEKGLLVIGDSESSGSLNAAMRSGRLAAQSVEAITRNS
ncbi:MAG: protoporphyrinogen/coproporphyrinogen oxidase [Luteibaculaceae bacterium]